MHCPNVCAVDVLKQLVAKCQPGAKALELCDFGDKTLTDLTGKVFRRQQEKGKEMKKGNRAASGVAFDVYIII